MPSSIVEIKEAITAFTGLEWQLVTRDGSELLETTHPCRHKSKVNFIERDVFQQTFGWLNRDTAGSPYQLIEHSQDPWSATLRILPQLTDQAIDDLMKRHRRQKTTRQLEEQTLRRQQAQWEKITGVHWQLVFDEGLLSPIDFLVNRADNVEHDPIPKLQKALQDYAMSKNLSSEAIVFRPVRHNNKTEKKWSILGSALTPVAEDYYSYCQDRHRREQYHARKLAIKISALLPQGSSVEVEDNDAFHQESRLFVQEDSATVLQHCCQILMPLISGGYSQKGLRISFALSQLSIPQLVHAQEEQQRAQHKAQTEALQHDYAALSLQLQTILQFEHHQLREQLLTVIRQTEERLTDRVALSEQRLVQKLDKRLEDFEAVVTKQLTRQGQTLDEIRTLVQRGQTYLMECHTVQMAAHQDQQQWLEQRLAQCTPAMSQELTDGWQNQLSQQLVQLFAKQEQALKAQMVPGIDSAKLDEALERLHSSWSEEQRQYLEAYQQQRDDYLKTQGATLEQTYQRMQALEHQLTQMSDQLTQKIAHESDRAEEMFKECRKAFEISKIPMPTVDPNDIQGTLHSAQQALRAGCQEQLAEQAIDYLCHAFGSRSAPNSIAKPDDFFKQSFVRKATESLRALQTATQADDRALGNQLADVAETLSDVFSVAIPGLRLIVKAAVFGTRKFLEYREQCFVDRIEQFIQHENLEQLFTTVAQQFEARYTAQLAQLNTQGLETLINRYLLPCIFAQMAKYEQQTLSTSQKIRLLLLSGQHNPPLVPIKLGTVQPRKHPWTAAGLVIGPLLVVDNLRYQRKDNPLRTLPWQPKPHRLYGERQGDAAELQQYPYERVSSGISPLSNIAVCATWSSQQLTVDYLKDNPDAWEEVNAQQETCWHQLAKQARFVAVLSAVLDHIEQQTNNVDDLKSRLLAGLLCTDAQDNTVYHLLSLQEDLNACYTQWKRLPIEHTARWDQAYNRDQSLALESIYSAWQQTPSKVHAVRLGQALSLLFQYSDSNTLPLMLTQYPALSTRVLSALPFDDRLISPLILAYQNGHRTLMSALLQGNTEVFHGQDAQGNTLLHLCIEQDDLNFLNAVIGQIDATHLTNTLSHRNHAGDTPLMLAVRGEHSALLWCLCQHDRIKGSANSQWGIQQAISLANSNAALLEPLNLLQTVPSLKGSSFFERQKDKASKLKQSLLHLGKK